VEIIPGWKIGAVLGLVYGIFGWWIYYPMMIESPLILVIGPLLIVSSLLSPLFLLLANHSGYEIIILPLSGLILGAIVGKGIEVVAGKMPDIDPWKKGTIIGFSIGFLGALCIAVSPLIGTFLVGPLVYLTAALLKIILPAVDTGSNLPVSLLTVIVVSSVSGSIAGYILGWKKCTPEDRDDIGRRQWVKRIAFVVICLIIVGAVLLTSGFIQPAKMLAPHYATSFGRMTVLTTFPDSPDSTTLYRVVSSDNGSVKIPVRTVEIIPASAAFEKLKNGDFQGNRFKCFCDYMLENVSAGYYQTGTGENQIYLEPAWVFRGTLSDGMPWEYFVYARKDYGSLQNILETP
jgi:hypothetical protein